jgi:hypothetical protein
MRWLSTTRTAKFFFYHLHAGVFQLLLGLSTDSSPHHHTTTSTYRNAWFEEQLYKRSSLALGLKQGNWSKEPRKSPGGKGNNRNQYKRLANSETLKLSSVRHREYSSKNSNASVTRTISYRTRGTIQLEVRGAGNLPTSSDRRWWVFDLREITTDGWHTWYKNSKIFDRTL